PFRSQGEKPGQHFLRGRAEPMPAGHGPGLRPQQLDGLGSLPVEWPPLPADYDPTRRPHQQESTPWIVRTALCIEPRHGRLHVFMPPVATTQDYLALITEIETPHPCV